MSETPTAGDRVAHVFRDYKSRSVIDINLPYEDYLLLLELIAAAIAAAESAAWIAGRDAAAQVCQQQVRRYDNNSCDYAAGYEYSKQSEQRGIGAQMCADVISALLPAGRGAGTGE